jgi:4-hydroxy 2-oxovalerate aldolase/long-chain acyl-CoA synthetase
MRKIEILECTLRDGSYTIDYQFTAKDTAMIALALEDVGFRKIEIGHGLGLNASRSKGKAAESDEVYLQTTNEVLTKAKFGMFFIPGIGRAKDLDLAARNGMDFVRIGTNVTQTEEAVPFVKQATDLGIAPTSNLMKSYALPPAKFAKKAKLVDDAGVEVITLVDSSGGMLPKDIIAYINALKKAEIRARIGFHGHNNISMAIANSLVAIENGASIVDTSLRGIGRSAGNAQTEVMVPVLKKLGYKLDIDEFRVMDIAESLIAPLMGTHDGIDSIAITSGYAEFHSSFMDIVSRLSKKYSIDPRRLIIEITKKDKINLPEELAETLAKQLHEERAALSSVAKIDVPSAFDISREKWNRKMSNKERARILGGQLVNLSKKTGKQTVFAVNVSGKSQNINFVYPTIQESSSYLMATCEMTSADGIAEVCKSMDGKVDFIILDDEKKQPGLENLYKTVSALVRSSMLLRYKDNSTWARGIEYFLVSYFGNVEGRKICILGAGDIAMKLAIGFSERGAKVSLHGQWNQRKVNAINQVTIKGKSFPVEHETDAAKFSKNAHVLIGTGSETMIGPGMVRDMKRGGIIVDATFNSIELAAIDAIRKAGILVWRTDLRASMTGEVTTVLRTNDLIKNFGRTILAGIPIVSGGYLGEKGDVVVDSIVDPKEIIGIADGRGSIMYGSELDYTEVIKKLHLEILQGKLVGQRKQIAKGGVDVS